ncbi:hypothetical protein V6N11_058200 [Hibiscus sabdariffa]|uniref:RNase H type-1 domain-containing protein n=1 Tax=Hibiscus sabdariffa TaxID=183260 RepID=A0ABR2NGH1_9ROSI
MSKRGRLETDNLTTGMDDGTQLEDLFDTTMGGADTTNPTGTVAAPTMNVHMNLNQGVQENRQPKLSFRDTLVGKNGLQSLEHTIKELDVVVTDEDVLYGGIRVTENRGSRFTILQDPKEVELEFEQAVNCAETHTPIESRDRPSNLMPRGKDPIVTTDLDDDIHRLDGEEITELEMGSVKEVASNDIINVAETTLNKVNHTAVRIGDNNAAQTTKETIRHILPASIRGGRSKSQIKIATTLKGGQRQGSKVKKKDDRGFAKPVLEARISALTSELDKAEAAEVERRKGNQGGGIQWHENETIEHALRSCSKARQAWESVVQSAKISTFLSLPFTDWILQCVTDVAGIGVGDDRWAARFSVFCWLIWKQQCNIVFNHNVNHGSSWIRYGNQLVDAWSGVADLHELMSRPWNVQLQHVKRDRNKVVDKLATLSRDMDIGEIVWENPPEEVLDALHHDIAGIYVQ